MKIDTTLYSETFCNAIWDAIYYEARREHAWYLYQEELLWEDIGTHLGLTTASARQTVGNYARASNRSITRNLSSFSDRDYAKARREHVWRLHEEGMKYAEIAVHFGISSSRVGDLLQGYYNQKWDEENEERRAAQKEKWEALTEEQILEAVATEEGHYRIENFGYRVRIIIGEY